MIWQAYNGANGVAARHSGSRPFPIPPKYPNRHAVMLDVHDGMGEEEVEVDVPPGKLCLFADPNEVASMPDDVYCCPKSKTLHSVDVLGQPDYICQVTKNLQHEPMQPARITECLQVLRAGKGDHPRPVYLTYVVPPESFKLKESQVRDPLSGEEMPSIIMRRVMRIPLMQEGASAYWPAHF
ncbi:g10025 [Coccomyxa elongata]